jgi:acetolactate synthase I/II/III large subunit
MAQVDVDARHAGWVYPVELAITGDAADVLQALRAAAGPGAATERLAAIAANNVEHGFGVLPPTVAAAGTLHYADLVRVLDRTLTPRTCWCWTPATTASGSRQQLRLRTPGQLVVPGGIGGMGWGLPAAAATRLVHPDRNVICLIGDGGAAMTLSTLATCVQEQLPITVIVANNQGLGMVRDNMKGRRIAVDFSPMDFATIARGMGCDGVRVDRADALGDAIAAAREAGRAGPHHGDRRRHRPRGQPRAGVGLLSHGRRARPAASGRRSPAAPATSAGPACSASRPRTRC